MRSDFWKKIDEEIEKEKQQEEENWKFKISQFKELNEHPGWLIYLKDIDEMVEMLNLHLEDMGFSEEPSMWKMGYHQGIRTALMKIKNHVKRILEEEEHGEG